MRESNGIIPRLSDSFTGVLLSDVTATDKQTEINRLSKYCSPKTVRYYHGFISSDLGIFRSN